ncbi:hypothetical protein GGR56DRAFT_303591 [Xylariaceae sp. FL0804]|nr:hypothetical protein GGR56DRAFT_303591 [Xylariaceae sp. FL0804]
MCCCGGRFVTTRSSAGNGTDTGPGVPHHIVPAVQMPGVGLGCGSSSRCPRSLRVWSGPPTRDGRALDSIPHSTPGTVSESARRSRESFSHPHHMAMKPIVNIPSAFLAHPSFLGPPSPFPIFSPSFSKRGDGLVREHLCFLALTIIVVTKARHSRREMRHFLPTTCHSLQRCSGLLPQPAATGQATPEQAACRYGSSSPCMPRFENRGRGRDEGTGGIVKVVPGPWMRSRRPKCRVSKLTGTFDIGP